MNFGVVPFAQNHYDFRFLFVGLLYVLGSGSDVENERELFYYYCFSGRDDLLGVIADLSDPVEIQNNRSVAFQ